MKIKKIIKNWRYHALFAMAATSFVTLMAESDLMVVTINTKMIFVLSLFSFYYFLGKWDRDGSIPELSEYMKEDKDKI